ncbi:hypothetical protein [Candidatus Ichthyocystis sparus]|uniref:hypothetical protein n=1 Tax=Candidatus Ichthyocystis sparus TaxID=1561004 RepID=UPI000B83C546|nr:hypothetical protein [Candidatus Ichthyocystis sparus]
MVVVRRRARDMLQRVILLFCTYSTSVYPTHASANPELSGPTSSVTTAARTCTDDLDFGAILDSIVAAARSYYHTAPRVADARASFAAAAVRAASIPDPDPARALASACGMNIDMLALLPFVLPMLTLPIMLLLKLLLVLLLCRSYY